MTGRLRDRAQLLRRSLSSLGWKPTIRNAIALATKRSDDVGLRAPGLRAPVRVRRHTADRLAFEQVFIDREYAFELPCPPEWIVDCGSHIGCSVVWFAQRYQHAAIVAVEPAPQNADLLRRNVAHLGQVEVIEGAIWAGDEETVYIEDPGASTVCFQVGPTGRGAGTPAVHIDDLITRASAARAGVGMVKLDIEGAELALFQGPSEWLDRVRYLVIELHDWLVPGCEAAMLAVLSDRPYTRSQQGENVVIQL